MTQNTHMTHLEDKVLYGGVDGTRQAILAVRELKNMLKGDQHGTVSVKWDGAPSIFAGIDPSDGVFFVAKKGIFNKSPKVYKSAADVDADTSGGLATKLKLALKYLPSIGITGVVQGDWLFGADELYYETIEGKDYVAFHPNTIVYAVPAESDAAKAITTAKLGIVWHTSYEGDSFETMEATFGVDINNFHKSDDVFYISSMMNINGSVTNENLIKVSEDLSECGKLFGKISSDTLNKIQSHEKLPILIEQFNNTFVRNGQGIGDTAGHVSGFIGWITSRFQTEIDKRKTARGKLVQQELLNDLLSFLNNDTQSDLKKIFDLQKHLVSAKIKVINTLDIVNEVKTFVKTDSGYKATKAEGYVAIDKLGGDAVKLVDRMEFSYNNFSPNILKGWEKPKGKVDGEEVRL